MLWLRRSWSRRVPSARLKQRSMTSYAIPDSRWTHVPATITTPAYSIFTFPIEKPLQDDREYRLVKLENGLEAMLIHDKDADTSAAAMDVSVGYLNDPDDMPGLAHFCEHMMFLGTKQFPKENGYNEYISANGGHTNAYTGASNTNYYFSVSSTSKPSSGTSTPLPHADSTPLPRKSPLPRALEMFASFFHSPLFSDEGTARELNAVDSENKKNSQSDRWRLSQLGKTLSGDIRNEDGILRKHPWTKFGTGNRDTLSAYGRMVAHRAAREESAAKEITTENGNPSPDRLLNGDSVIPDEVDPSNPLPPLPSESTPDGGLVGRETRRRLMEWWEREYCAGRMKLAILGRETLDELTHLTTTLFSPVVNRSRDPRPLITESPLGPNEQGTIVEAKTVMDFRAIEISFHLPWKMPLYRSKPSGYLGHFLGHEGPGSVHSYLKAKGWITGLSVGTSNLGRGFSKFSIWVILTKEGFENYITILSTIFKYLSLLRSSPLEKYHHEEISAMAEIHFKFTEKERAEYYVSDIASNMADPYAREHLLSGVTRVWDWDEAKIREILNSFTLESSRVTVVAKEFQDDSRWQHETWYNTEYRVRRISEELIREAQKPNDITELYLPKPNAFIPTDLEVQKIDVSDPAKRPRKVLETPLFTLWHKKDDQFWVPKASFNAYVITPLSHITPRHALKSQFFTELVSDALTEYSYDASLAGLGFSFGSYDRGVFISSAGYNQKIPILLKTVLDTMKTFKINSSRFEVIKEDLKLDYENFYLNDPHRISDYWTDYLLNPEIWTPREKLAELENLTIEEVQSHIDLLLSRVHVISLANGNIIESEAEALIKLVEETIGAHAVTPSEKVTKRNLLLPQGASHVYKTEVPNPKEVNSSLTYFCQVGYVTQRELRALNGLLAHMMREPAFDELRTKQQLGYIVFLTEREFRGVIGLRFVVQSEREPVYLESRVEAFLEKYRTQLASMALEDFEGKKEGLISRKQEKLTNLYDETSRFWSHVTSGYCDFLRNDDDVETLRKTTLADVLKFYDTYVLPDSPERRKLSVHVRSQIVPTTAPQRFSVAASEAFLTRLKSHGIPVEENQYRELSAAEPPLEAVKEFWTDSFKKSPGLDESSKTALLNAIEEIAQMHPAAGTQPLGKAELRPGSIVIDDMATFKAGLKMGPAAVPVS